MDLGPLRGLMTINRPDSEVILVQCIIQDLIEEAEVETNSLMLIQITRRCAGRSVT